jgi:predicted metalloendopeptidase
MECRLLYGREEMPARWKFCIAYVNGNLGMAVGSLFVTKYFDGQSKQDVRNAIRTNIFHVLL